MDNSIDVQLYIFLTLFYDGLIIGLLFDTYKALRYFFKPNKIVTFFEDLLFWIIIVAVTFYFLLRSSAGELRGYNFVGIILGVTLYMYTLSKLIYPLLLKVFRIIIKIFEKFYKILLLPFTLLKVMLKPYINKFKKIKQASKESIKDMKKYFKLISTKK